MKSKINFAHAFCFVITKEQVQEAKRLAEKIKDQVGFYSDVRIEFDGVAKDFTFDEFIGKLGFKNI